MLLLMIFVSNACRDKAPPGPPQDLMDQTYLVFSPGGDEDLVSPITLGGESRPALIARTPAEFRYRVHVPERATLTFALGILQAPGTTSESEPSEPSEEDEPLPGNRMRFEVRAGEDGADELFFEREIHVARRGQWIEQQVDLRRLSGREVWLVFKSSFPGAEDREEPLPLIGVFGDPVLHDRARFREGRGVVLVSIDTLRRDHMSVYGYPRKTTPGLEAFATEAIVFDDAVSTSSWTLPAHASLLTSTYPSAHGAVNLNVGLSRSWPNLATLFRKSGFTTQAMVTHVYLAPEYGFDEGFDRHQYLPETRAEELTDRAVRFLSAMGDRDFFLFVHYYDPHWHYDPPPPYDTEFDPSYEGEVSGVWWDFKELAADEVDARDLHHIKALYDGEILYTDRHVERLFREMKSLGIFDKSVIVVTSDHGEEFLEHGHWEHQKTLYEELLRIPLLVKLPNGKGSGRRISEQVSLVDVAPTILEALSVPRPPSFEGRSLFELLGASPKSGRREAWSETEHTVDDSRKLSLRLGAEGRKAIFSLRDGSVDIELFDLARDPGELQALGPTLINDRARKAFEKRLEEYLRDMAAAREGNQDIPAVELDPEERERLRSLGYIR